MDNAIVFDLDGTLNDFYRVPTWQTDIREENVRPYAECESRVNFKELNKVCRELRNRGFSIVVVSWLANNSSKEYSKATREAKKEWLAKNGFDYDEIHIVKYGTPKARCLTKYGGYRILIDDNAEVRKEFCKSKNNFAIDANADIVKILNNMIGR